MDKEILDAAFATLMEKFEDGSSNDNIINWRRLIDVLKGNGVTLVVGAGMSRPLGYEMWRSFLIKNSPPTRIIPQETPTWARLQNTLLGDDIKQSWRDWMTALCNANRYEEAAEYLIDELGVLSFNGRISAMFGTYTMLDINTTGPDVAKIKSAPVWLLPKISKQVITTNFDPVLEFIYGNQAGVPQSFVFPGKVSVGPDTAPVDQAFDAGDPFLLKLHGSNETEVNRVLTLTEFRNQYGEEAPETIDMDKPIPRLLRKIVNRRPLLFLGCSLQQDSLTRTLLKIIKVEKGQQGRHFAIIPSASPWDFPESPAPTLEDLLEAQYERRNQLERAGVFSLCYPAQPTLTRAEASKIDPNLYLNAILHKIIEARKPESRGTKPPPKPPPLPYTGCPVPIAPLMCDRADHCAKLDIVLSAATYIKGVIIPGVQEDCHGSLFRRILYDNEKGPLYNALKNLNALNDRGIPEEDDEIGVLRPENITLPGGSIGAFFRRAIGSQSPDALVQLKNDIFHPLRKVILNPMKLPSDEVDRYTRLGGDATVDDVIWILKRQPKRGRVLQFFLPYDSLDNSSGQVLMALFRFLWDVNRKITSEIQQGSYTDEAICRLFLFFNAKSNKPILDPKILEHLYKAYQEIVPRVEEDPAQLFAQAFPVLNILPMVLDAEIDAWSLWWQQKYGRHKYYPSAAVRYAAARSYLFPQANIARRMREIEKVLAECHNGGLDHEWCNFP